MPPTPPAKKPWVRPGMPPRPGQGNPVTFSFPPPDQVKKVHDEDIDEDKSDAEGTVQPPQPRGAQSTSASKLSHISLLAAALLVVVAVVLAMKVQSLSDQVKSLSANQQKALDDSAAAQARAGNAEEQAKQIKVATDAAMAANQAQVSDAKATSDALKLDIEALKLATAAAAKAGEDDNDNAEGEMGQEEGKKDGEDEEKDEAKAEADRKEDEADDGKPAADGEATAAEAKNEEGGDAPAEAPADAPAEKDEG